jgi:hypothetical protein
MGKRIPGQSVKKVLAFRRKTALVRRGRASAARAEQPEGGDESAQTSGRRQAKDKMTVLISSQVRRRLRVASAIQDRDISQVVEDAIQLYLDTWERERASRGLPPMTVE